MSKTSYFLAIIFLIIVVCFLVAAFFYPQARSLPSITTKEKAPTTSALSILSLNPTTQTVVPGQSAYVDIFISNENVSPDTIQLEIGYDPYTVIPIAVTPGGYFMEQTVLLNTINPRNSRITFAITCTNKPSPCGSDPTKSIARISFSISPSALKRETAITILPKTLVTSTNTPDITVKTASTKLFIQGVQMPQASPSAMILPQ